MFLATFLGCMSGDSVPPVAAGPVATEAAAVATAPTSPAPAPPPPPLPASITILGAGDVIPHDPVKLSGARYGWASLFAEIAPMVQAADLAIVNLETPIAPVRNGRLGEKVFNAPVELAVALRDAGFDGAALANNHVWDQRTDGLLETLSNLDQVGLVHAGAGATCADAQKPVFFERNGIKVGWFSTTRIHNLYLNRGPDEPCVFKFDVDDILAGVASARADGAALIVLSLHWGVEYQTTPKDWDERFARTLIAGGVDIILAHHPHVLQSARWIEKNGRRGVVIHSLGNLMAAQGWSAGAASGSSQALRRDGGLFEVVAERTTEGVHLVSARLHPTWVEHGQTGCRGRPSRMRTVLIEAALGDPAYAGCGYAARLPLVRRIVGAEFLTPK